MLLKCLSPNSATMAKLNSGGFIGSKRQQEVTVEGPKAAELAFQNLFKK